MIVSAYRLEELTAGRTANAIRWKKQLSNCGATYGNITLDLDQAIETRGMEFVHQYLACNRTT